MDLQTEWFEGALPAQGPLLPYQFLNDLIADIIKTMDKKLFILAIVVVILMAGLMVVITEKSRLQEPPVDSGYDVGELGWEDIEREAAREGSVIVSTWWAEAYFLKVAKLFSEKYGIHAEVVVQPNETTLQKILLEKNLERGSIDIFIAGFAGHLQKALDENIFFRGVNKIPDWDRLLEPDRVYQKNLYIENLMVPLYRNQVGFLYDPEKVVSPPRNWGDFNNWIRANPGKFVFSAVKDGSGEAFKHSVVYQLTGGHEKYRTGSRHIDPGKVKEWDLVWTWFLDNREYLGFSSSNHDSLKRIQYGQAWITPAFVDDTTIAMNSGLLDRRFEMYMPDFGLFRGGDAAGIVVNSPHKAASLLFLQFLVSKDIQLMMKEMIGSDCIRSDIENPDSSFLSQSERKKAIDHPDPVYYIFLESEFKKNVLGE